MQWWKVRKGVFIPILGFVKKDLNPHCLKVDAIFSGMKSILRCETPPFEGLVWELMKNHLSGPQSP